MSRRSERNALYRDLVGLGLPELPSGYYYFFDTIERSEEKDFLGVLTVKIFKERFFLSDVEQTYDALIDESIEPGQHRYYKWTFSDMVELGTIAHKNLDKILDHTSQIGFYLGKKLP